MTISAVPPTMPIKKFSNQMLAVLMIFSADQSLMRQVESHINLASEEINWDEIRKISFSPGHWAAVLVAYSVWTDQVFEGANVFEAALNMDRQLKRACIQALMLRWELKA
jgi:hypothetical protein